MRDLVLAFAVALAGCGSPAAPSPPRVGGGGCASPAEAYECGKRLAEGREVRRDLPAAADHFRRACDGGSARGCFGLARLHQVGLGAPFDLAAALGLLGRACDGGDPDGCLELAAMRRAGRGAPADPRAADRATTRGRELHERGCRGGDQTLCAELGVHILMGTFVPPGASADVARASALLTASCEASDATGCVYLGMFRLNGHIGIAPDPAGAAAVF
jgi:TPR repeat protein